MHPGIAPIIGGVAPKILTFRTFATGPDENTNFPGLDAGPAAADRRCIVGITGQGLALRTITSLTVGGVAATVLVTLGQDTRRTALYIAHVPLGATVDVDPVWSGQLADVGVSLWTLTGVSSDVPHDTKTGNGSPLVATGLLTLESGCAVAVAGAQNSTAATWTNATERYETFDEGRTWTGADDPATTGAALTITCTGASGFGNSRGICAASF